MRILVCGSRHYEDEDRIRQVLQEYDDPRNVPVSVLHGDYPTGVDRIVDDIAWLIGFEVQRFPTHWRYKRRGKGLRDREMLDQRPDLVIVFGDDRNVTGLVTEAVLRGIRVRREL